MACRPNQLSDAEVLPIEICGEYVGLHDDKYDFKLGLRTSRIGMITHFDLLPERPHDIQRLDDLLDGFQQGTILADKGFIDAHHQATLAQRDINLVRRHVRTWPR